MHLKCEAFSYEQNLRTVVTTVQWR